MAMRCIMPDSVYYAAINALACAIAWGKNPHVFFGLKDIDTTTPEHKADIQRMLTEQQALFDDGALIGQVDEVLRGAGGMR